MPAAGGSLPHSCRPLATPCHQRCLVTGVCCAMELWQHHAALHLSPSDGNIMPLAPGDITITITRNTPPKTITPVNCSSRFPLPSHHYQIINHAINEITISTIGADTQHTIIVVNPLLLLKACVCAELDGFGWQEKSHHRHHHPENSFSSSPQFQKRIASR